jgi:uncharacterized phage protein (TIGR02218 family)
VKNWSPELQASYAKGTTTLATCVKITRRDGVVLCMTSHDSALEVDGVWYLPAVGYTASEVESTSELNPDNLEVTGVLKSPAITDEDIHAGVWDYAAVLLFEVDYEDTTIGINELRAGTFGEVKGGRSQFNAEFRGLMQAYTRRIVRLTTKDCTADLGDSRCKINLAAWTVTGTVAGVTDNRVISDGARSEADDWFTAGKLTFLSGLNAGLSMEVKRSTSGQLTLHERMPYEIQTGDTYSVYAGCTKRAFEDCRDKFNNYVNFRGFPDVPGASVYRRGSEGVSTTTTTA